MDLKLERAELALAQGVMPVLRLTFADGREALVGAGHPWRPLEEDVVVLDTDGWGGALEPVTLREGQVLTSAVCSRELADLVRELDRAAQQRPFQPRILLGQPAAPNPNERPRRAT